MFRRYPSRWITRWLGLFLVSLISLLALGRVHAQDLPAQSVPNVQSPAASALVQQGLDRYHQGDFRGAIDLWQQNLRTDPSPEQQVITWKYLARAYQQVGQEDGAIALFEQLIRHYRQVGDPIQGGRMLTEQAQAYSELGQHRRAIEKLCGSVGASLECIPESALAIAQDQDDREGQVAALGSLGNAYYLLGDYESAITLLTQSQKISEQAGLGIYSSAILNNLGNAYSSLAQRNYRYLQLARQVQDQQEMQRFSQQAADYDRRAIVALTTSLTLSQRRADSWNELRALLNLVLPYQRQGQSHQSLQDLIRQAQTLLTRLPQTRETAYATLRLANLVDGINSRSKIPLRAGQCGTTPPSPAEIALLNRAVTIARTLGDQQTESFALGELGHRDECLGNYDRALKLTLQAQLLAVAKESLYLWEWQTGRILKAMDRMDEAIASYEQSVTTLQDIQGNIAAAGRDLQLDFRDTVEVIYRQLVDLRVRQAEASTSEPALQANLISAQITLDGLRLAELRNYLGEGCEFPAMQPPPIATDPGVAVLKSILLDDQIALILTLPGQGNQPKLRFHSIPMRRDSAVELVNTFRRQLEQRSDRTNAYKPTAQQLYTWLIQPFVRDLEAQQIKTLVFAHDGIFRTIPMATLHDGTQFLVQKYAIVNTPTLVLSQPAQTQTRNLRALAFGLTNPSAIDGNTFFPPLSAVKQEIDSIQTALPGSSSYMDENFTRDRLQQELAKNTYSILHFATHARFGFDARETFLVTGKQIQPKNSAGSQAYNERLTLNELYQTVQRLQQRTERIELLTLTGCETAVGSDRDALGLAGVALQAGVPTAIASLWQVDDVATATMMAQFYQNLHGGASKAVALQTTQRQWLTTNPRGRYRHPGYWAAFILIGDWR